MIMWAPAWAVKSEMMKITIGTILLRGMSISTAVDDRRMEGLLLKDGKDRGLKVPDFLGIKSE